MLTESRSLLVGGRIVCAGGKIQIPVIPISVTESENRQSIPSTFFVLYYDFDIRLKRSTFVYGRTFCPRTHRRLCQHFCGHALIVEASTTATNFNVIIRKDPKLRCRSCNRFYFSSTILGIFSHFLWHGYQIVPNLSGSCPIFLEPLSPVASRHR